MMKYNCIDQKIDKQFQANEEHKDQTKTSFKKNKSWLLPKLFSFPQAIKDNTRNVILKLIFKQRKYRFDEH